MRWYVKDGIVFNENGQSMFGSVEINCGTDLQTLCDQHNTLEYWIADVRSDRNDSICDSINDVVVFDNNQKGVY